MFRSCSIRYSFKRCLALTVFLFKCRFVFINSFYFMMPGDEVLQVAWRPWRSSSFRPCGWRTLGNRAFDFVTTEADSPHGSGQPMCRGANRTDLTLECCR